MFAALIGLIGCGTPEATNIMESSDRSAIEAYEAAIAAEDAAMDADSGNADALGNAAPSVDAPAGQ